MQFRVNQDIRVFHSYNLSRIKGFRYLLAAPAERDPKYRELLSILLNQSIVLDEQLRYIHHTA